MHRIEINLQTGTQTVIPLTEKDIVEAKTRYEEELINPYSKSVKAAAKGWLWAKNKLKGKS
jgi:hypothetical protein